MIPDMIEKVIREFDFATFGIEGFSDLADPNTHEWPPELAAQITAELADIISAVLTDAVDQGFKVGQLFGGSPS